MCRPAQILIAAIVLSCGFRVGGAKAQGAYQIYQYDTLGNLVDAWDSAGRNAQPSYDPAQNRTSVQIVAGASPAPPPAPLPQSVTAFRIVKTKPHTAIVPRSP